MRKLLTLFFYICFLFMLFANTTYSQQNSHKHKIKTFPPKDENGCVFTYASRFHREKPDNIGGKLTYLFRSNFVQIPHYNCFPIIEKVDLSKKLIFTNCNEEDARCFDKTREIKVSVKAVDFENDVFLYIYYVSSGKIIGQGKEVIWDLSNAPVGTHIIIICVDDVKGCSASNEKNVWEEEVLICQ